ncbi:MAG: ABC transporter ATP-binding protein [Proteobacteria bacterium]|nr:MAG: ABC transporter ATP-binding protein [Pseudomonadota bacterium]
MLEIQQVKQSFRTGFWLKQAEILKGVSFQVPTRSVFGFLGPNGAGKTTLIHLIVGMKQPKFGSIQWNGVPTFQSISKAKIGYLPERPYFHDFLTGEEMLIYFGRLSGMSRAQVLSRAGSVLDKVGMSHARHLELRKYSKGMLQRMGIAQAILHDPEFLVLDEPMSGLDPSGRKEIRDLIRQLSREGRTIFFSSHVIPDVEAICDQVAIIKKGQIVESGPISKFLVQETAGMELEFTGVDPDLIFGVNTAITLNRQEHWVRAIIPKSENTQQILKRVIDQGGTVQSLTPIRSSLEEQFNG